MRSVVGKNVVSFTPHSRKKSVTCLKRPEIWNADSYVNCREVSARYRAQQPPAGRCEGIGLPETFASDIRKKGSVTSRVDVQQSKKIRNIVVPDACLNPIFSYHFGESGVWPNVSPVFGCFISADSVCLHRPEFNGEGGTVEFFPLPTGTIPEDVYRIVPALKDDHADTVCPGGWGVPYLPASCIAYSVYADGDRQTLGFKDQQCWYKNRAPGADRVFDYIDSICQPLLKNEVAQK